MNNDRGFESKMKESITSVLKIIHPIKSIGTSGKISYDDGEPAIHIEIKQ